MRNGTVASVVQLFVPVLHQCRVLLTRAIGGTARVFSERLNTVSVTGGNFLRDWICAGNADCLQQAGCVCETLILSPIRFVRGSCI
jgi:hypothetical protein